MIPIAIALSLLLAAPARSQEVRFHDAQGRVTGGARIDANGVTTFYDRAGRVTGSARTDANGVTRFYDAMGRTTLTALVQNPFLGSAQLPAPALTHLQAPLAPIGLTQTLASITSPMMFLTLTTL